jgi:hypothetical protein
MADSLLVEHLSQVDRGRGGENVTVMLCNVGLSVRCRTGSAVSTLKRGTSHAWTFSTLAASGVVHRHVVHVTQRRGTYLEKVSERSSTYCVE